MISHCDSVFVVWNILISLKLQLPIQVEKESSGEELEQHCYMVQGNVSLEVYSKSQLDDSASSSRNDHIDADALNEKLSLVCENLLEKYQLLKKKTFKLNKENKDLFLNLILLFKRGMRF